MARETVTEFEVVEEQKNVEVVYCDVCNNKIGRADEHPAVADFALNPSFDFEPFVWTDRRDAVMDITESLTGVDVEDPHNYEFGPDDKTLVTNSPIIFGVRDNPGDMTEITWEENMVEMTHQAVSDAIKDYQDMVYQRIKETTLNTEHHGEICMSCCELMGLDVENAGSMFDIEEEERLEEEMLDLKRELGESHSDWSNISKEISFAYSIITAFTYFLFGSGASGNTVLHIGTTIGVFMLGFLFAWILSVAIIHIHRQ